MPCCTRYELCNRYGLYVVDEANVETHGFDPALCNNHLNPVCSPLWLNAILGGLYSLFLRVSRWVAAPQGCLLAALAQRHRGWVSFAFRGLSGLYFSICRGEEVGCAIITSTPPAPPS